MRLRVRVRLISPAVPAVVSALFVWWGVHELVAGDVLRGVWMLLTTVPLAAGFLYLMVDRDLFTLDADGIHPATGGQIPWADIEALVLIDDPDADPDEPPSHCLGVRLRRYDGYLASLAPDTDTVLVAEGLAEQRQSRGAEFAWPDGDLTPSSSTVRRVARELGGV